MIQMNNELIKILESHKKWIMGDPEGQRAILKNIDLHDEDLSYYCLREADLSGANSSKYEDSIIPISGRPY